MVDFLWIILALLLAAAALASLKYLGRAAAAAVAALGAVLYVYARGSADAKKEAKRRSRLDDLERANDINTQASRARADSERRSADVGELRNTDGFRRD